VSNKAIRLRDVIIDTRLRAGIAPFALWNSRLEAVGLDPGDTSVASRGLPPKSVSREKVELMSMFRRSRILGFAPQPTSPPPSYLYSAKRRAMSACNEPMDTGCTLPASAACPARVRPTSPIGCTQNVLPHAASSDLWAMQALRRSSLPTLNPFSIGPNRSASQSLCCPDVSRVRGLASNRCRTMDPSRPGSSDPDRN